MSFFGPRMLCPKHLNQVLSLSRRSLFSTQTTSNSRPFLPANAGHASNKYRSKHYDPKNVPTGQVQRKLEPHVLSVRLKTLCDQGKLDNAIDTLKNMPRDAQNTAVWNSLMWECMKDKRFQTAYQLYVDMKRRGFRANIRTYQTLLTGLSKIDDWSKHPKQLNNARSLYEHFRNHISTIRADASAQEMLSNAPLVAYFRILGDNGLQQEMFDVYYGLEQEGLLVADHLLYTSMFQALSASNRHSLENEDTLQHAASARLLWTLMLKVSSKAGFPVDAFLVAAAIKALSRGSSADQNFAIRLASKYFGIAGDQPTNGLVPLSAPALAAILSLCNVNKRFQDCVDIFNQVIERPTASGGADIIDRAHVEEVLYAHGRLLHTAKASFILLEWALRQEITSNGPKLRPNKGTYDLVLRNCFRDADWRLCVQTFELMTGFHCHDFADGSTVEKPRRDKRSESRTIDADADTLTHVLRTALTTGNVADLRQALRITEHMLELVPRNGRPPIISAANKPSKARTFSSRLATIIVQAVDRVASSKSDGPRTHHRQERERWMRLAEVMGRFSGQTSASEFIPIVSATKRDPRRLTKYERSLSS